MICVFVKSFRIIFGFAVFFNDFHTYVVLRSNAGLGLKYTSLQSLCGISGKPKSLVCTR